MEDTIEDVLGRPGRKSIRKWSDVELHERLAGHDLHKAERSMAEAELRRRDAWAAPAGRAFYVSLAALALSLIAIIISLSKQA